MNDLTTLIKKQLGFYIDIKGYFNDKKSRKKFFAVIFSSFILLFYLYLMQKGLFKYYDLYLEQGKAKDLLITGISTYLSAVLIFTTANNIAKIYYSDETKILLRLPIKHSSIFISKILSVSFSALFYSILLVFPMIYKIGVFYNKSILFYIASLISVYLSTVILISIEMIVIVWIMYFVNKSKVLKNTFKYISTVLFFVVIIGLQFFIQIGMGSSSERDILNTVDESKNIFTKVFPQVNLFTNALLGDSFGISLLNFFLLLLISILILFIVVKLGYKRMVSGILNENVVSSKPKKTSKVSEYKNEPVYMTICKKDLSNIFHNANYLINKFTMGIIFPLFFAGSFYFNAKNDNEFDINTVFTSIEEFIKANYIQSLGIILLGFIPLGLFFASSSQLTSSTFSREGKKIWMMKVYPIKIKDQVLGRILSSSIFLVLSYIPILLIISFLVKFDIGIILSLLLASVIIALFSSSLNLIFGILFSNTTWDNPNEAIKGSKSMIQFFVNIAIIVGLVYLFIKVFSPGLENLSQNIIAIPLIIYLILAILAFVLYVIDKKLLEKNLIKID